MTSNYNSAVRTSVGEDVIKAVRRILEIAADEGVSIAPALSRGLAEALTPQRGDTKCPAQCSATREHEDKSSTATPCDTQCPAQSAAPLADDKANKANKTNDNKDKTAEVSGYYTPEEAEALIEKIRTWLSGCRDRHSLADLMESIKQKFQLYDSQLGELLGISDRLVGHVRHGRPSPFALVRFTEVFGEAGASTDKVSGSVRTQKGE